MIPKLSVIVPWWDHGELLDLWIDNLQHLPEAELIFVDNGSQQLTAQLLLDWYEAGRITRLLRFPDNRGFAYANNAGVQVASSERLLFLNNDVELRANLTDYVVSRLHYSGIWGPGPRVSDWGTDYVEGWCLAMQRADFDRLGGFSLDFGAGYWEDTDLCYRASQLGIPLRGWAGLSVVISHLGNTTGLDGRLDQANLHIQNRLRFYQKHIRQVVA